MKQLTTLSLSFILAVSLNAGTIVTTATLTGVNGNTLDGVYSGPYTEDVGGVDLQVWCADPTKDSVIGQSYQATVTTGDNIPGLSQAVVDEIYGVVGLASAGDASDPEYQQAIWHLADPTQYPDSAAIESILSRVSQLTIFPGSFEWISGVGQQPYVAVVPVVGSPEPSTIFMVMIGMALIFTKPLVSRFAAV